MKVNRGRVAAFRNCVSGEFRCVVPTDLRATTNIRNRNVQVPRRHAKSTVESGVFNPYRFKHSDPYAEERELNRLLYAAEGFMTERDDEEGDDEPFEDGIGYAFEWGSYNDFGNS